MSDEQPATGDEQQENNDLGDAGKRALDAEREARKAAEQRVKALESQLTPLQDKVQQIEDAGKSELEKEREKRAELEKQLADATSAQLRYEVATSKGVPAEAIKFLTGASRDELETTADELLKIINRKPVIETPPKELTPAGKQPDGDSLLTPEQLADRIYKKTH